MYPYDAVEAGVVGAVLGVFVVIVLFVYVLSLGILVMRIIANWKIFAKSGEPGWKCLIPYYNVYTEYKLFWRPGVFWAYLALAVCSSVLSFLYGIASVFIDSVIEVSAPAVIVLIFAFILYCLVSVATFVLHILLQVGMAKTFGKNAGFTVGLIFLPTVFRLILAFGKARYLGNPYTGHGKAQPAPVPPLPPQENTQP